MTIQISDLVNDDASLISRKCWSSQAVYEVEKRAIFARCWLYVGHESQLKSPGDFIQAFMAETPVIVARGEDNKIHVSLNSCTHRGLPVCRADYGHTKRFVCPYHNWSYTVEGKLVSIPQERELETCPDKSKLGLRQVPRVESWRGLIFASFDEEIEALEDYLGDMRFYLDAFMGRFDNGIEIMGAPHKWLINANWKLPMENQLGDVNHGPSLHATIIPAESNTEILKYGYSAVTAPGHGATFRLAPDDYPVERYAWGFEGFGGALGSPEVKEYLLEIQARAEERVGPVRARMKGLTFGIYPNFSFQWSATAFKVSHPRGPGQVEYWTWSVVPADAPDAVKTAIRTNYTSLFGPGGMVEQEDSEAWAQQFCGARADFVDDRKLFYGLGLGEEKPHADLPGLVSVTANEHYARAFFKRWRTALEQVESDHV